jgi:hypothetical protein
LSKEQSVHNVLSTSIAYFIVAREMTMNSQRQASLLAALDMRMRDAALRRQHKRV